MATYSPTVLAYPEGITLGNAGSTRLVGSTAHDTGEGIYYGPTPPAIENVVNGQRYAPIFVGGYDELYVMPVSTVAADAANINIYVIYGNKQVDSDQTQWFVHRLASSTLANGGRAMTAPNGTAYLGLNFSVFANGFNAVLDSTIGAASAQIAGTSSVMGTAGFPHIGGADYIAITFNGVASPTGNSTVNAYIRFG